MKKGQRRRISHKRNKLVTPQGVKSKKKLRKNPAFGLMDQKAMRQVVNQAIGSLLIGALDIDFIGILEKRAEDEPKAPDTIQ